MDAVSNISLHLPKETMNIVRTIATIKYACICRLLTCMLSKLTWFHGRRDEMTVTGAGDLTYVEFHG